MHVAPTPLPIGASRNGISLPDSLANVIVVAAVMSLFLLHSNLVE
jgi:hypothetical protein